VIAQTVQDVQNASVIVFIVAIAWAVFVLAFMVSIWGHLGALRHKLAPTVEPVVWEVSGASYGVGVPLLQPMYGIWARGNERVPVAVFPFTMDGKTEAISRLELLEQQKQSP
jgi:hypothetical protein